MNDILKVTREILSRPGSKIDSWLSLHTYAEKSLHIYLSDAEAKNIYKRIKMRPVALVAHAEQGTRCHDIDSMSSSMPVLINDKEI